MSKVLFETGAECSDSPPVVSRGATGDDSVIEPRDVVLLAKITEGNIRSGDSGAVPRGGEGGVEDEDGDGEGSSAGVNIEDELEAEGAALSEACSLCSNGWVGIVEFAGETTHGPMSVNSIQSHDHDGFRSQESLTLSLAMAFPPY